MLHAVPELCLQTSLVIFDFTDHKYRFFSYVIMFHLIFCDILPRKMCDTLPYLQGKICVPFLNKQIYFTFNRSKSNSVYFTWH